MFQAEAATEEGSLDKAWSYRNGAQRYDGRPLPRVEEDRFEWISSRRAQ